MREARRTSDGKTLRSVAVLSRSGTIGRAIETCSIHTILSLGECNLLGDTGAAYRLNDSPIPSFLLRPQVLCSQT